MPAFFLSAPVGESHGRFDAATATVSVTVDAPVVVLFQDDWTRDCDPADIVFRETNFAAITPLTMIAQRQAFRLEFNRTGVGVLEAREPLAAGRFLRDAPLRARLIVNVEAEPDTPTRRLRVAYEEGRIFFATGFEGGERLFKMALNGDKFEGKPVMHSPELENALVTLSKNSPVQIMRTFAPRNSFHGKLEGDKWVCSCADILRYRGFVFQWQQAKTSLINGVANLLRDLPGDVKYDFGFTRPVGGPSGSKPEADVFFEVRTPAQIAAAWNGTARPISDILPDAAKVITPLLRAKTVGFVYADGADHMHMRAY